MHNIALIQTFAGGLAAALVLGYLARLVGLSPMVGYIVAGIVVGPHTPGFEADRDMAKQLAEVGIILLMFGVGLHFHLDELVAVRRIAVPGAIGQSLIATVCGTLMAHAFGGTWSEGIVFGLAISVASTVVLTRVLADNREMHSPTGRIAVGWLIVEDLFTVVVLVLLPSVARQAGMFDIGLALLMVVVKIVALLMSVFLVGGRLIPWLLERAAATRSSELFTLTVLVVAMGIAVGSAKVFGVSMELGAFLAGMIVGRSEFSLRAASEALPMRDAFAVLFFVSVGMLFEPQILIDQPLRIAATLAIVIIAKPLAALAMVLVLGYPLRTALAVAVALGQIGEFSFVLANMGMELHILSDDANNILVAAAIFSIGINPLLYRWVDPLERWIEQHTRFGARLAARGRGAEQAGEAEAPVDIRRRSVIVGYGPVGRTVARLLQDYGVTPTIIDLNLEVVRGLREQGIDAVYGDATHSDILKAAGVSRAGSLILSSAGMSGAEETIRQARDLNCKIRILARTNYVREVPVLRAAGAEAVFSGEGEIALSVTEFVLRELGAPEEEIDLERQRIRAEMM